MVREPLNDLSVIDSVVVGSLVTSVVSIVVDSTFSVVSVTDSIYNITIIIKIGHLWKSCNGLLFENSHK